MSIYNNITELIGQTPIVKLNNIVPEGAADVYIKLEAFNPGSSVKDRIALSMIEKAEQDGILKLGSTIVEATSGNTGIGLSWVGAAKGYKVVIVMPETMSVERRKIIQAYGAELVLTPGSEGMKGAIAKAQEIAAERDGFLPLQFDNPANPEVHERTTGAEILAAFGKDGLDAFVAGVGTGGKEGFLVGISSAAAIYGAIEVAKKLGTGKKVLALAPDNGERYLSTALYEL
ncbi:TPA: PLP-dependent cysteine synthase family protein [Streptococcus pneumoniae]|nr:PLP-dependent cysteine synthase family protein [Streptococcus pneumoniae]HEU6966985.1 PLP-dependent cysteine synthase family protein [Streptococcus pneumoniae]